MKVQAIVFDCFGVVVGRGVWKIFELAGGDLKKDAAFLEEVVNKEALNIYTSKEFHEALATKLGWKLQKWLDFYVGHDGPNEDVLTYIQDLKVNYKTALLSNAAAGVIQKRLTTKQLAIFDEVIISGEVGVKKPDPAIFELAAKRLEVNPNECIFIDDHEPYLAGANMVGMKTVHFTGLQNLSNKLLNIL